MVFDCEMFGRVVEVCFSMLARIYGNVLQFQKILF